MHPAARPEFDRGPLDPARRIANLSLVFKLSPAQRAERDALKAAQLDPASPSYHRWLTPEQYAARFGARPADIERAKSWLASQGLEVHESSRLGSRVTFSGTVANVQAAFRAPMRRYEVEGEMHYAMSARAQVPASLADVVLDVTNTHDFFPRPTVRPAADSPDYTSGSSKGFAPPDWANVYDVTPLYTTGVAGAPITGAGVTIAVVGVAAIAQSDVAAWRSTFGLPASAFTATLVPNTGAAQAGSQGTGMEAALDVEWTGGIGTGATVNYVFTGANDGNVDDATYYIIENNLGDVLSESWGGCDGAYLQAGLTASDENVIDVYGSAANLLGITYVAASGDSGAASCLGFGTSGLYVNTPAAYPGVTAVGGTQFPKTALTGTPYFTSYSTLEAAWDEANGSGGYVAAGGGGISSLFSRPSYQSGVPTCAIVGSLPVAGVTPANMRQVPDVSFTSAGATSTYDAEYVMCTVTGGDCSATGGAPKLSPGAGTSFATPAFAGVVALLDQVAGGRLGNINPLLYALNATTPTAFHDVTTGTNEVKCTVGTDPGCAASGRYGYAAAAGYDCATGLGSLDVTVLAKAWHALAPTATTVLAAPTASSEGAPVVLSSTITVTSPNAQVLGGTVSFAFQTYTATNAPDLAWTLGASAIVAPTVAGGTGTLSVAIPPGLVRPGAQYADVVAEYSGDAYHLPSKSAPARVTFAPVDLCILPSYEALATGGAAQFTSTGGVPPVKWYVSYDSTCNSAGTTCAVLNETTGALTAGPVAGWIVVDGIDADGAEQVANLTAGSPTGTPPWGTTNVPPGACMVTVVDAGTTDSGSTVDSGTAVDSGTVVVDSGSPSDSGTVADSGSSTDSGSTADSGAHADASAAKDSGAIADSGSPTDASMTADTGSTSSDGATGDEASADGAASADASSGGTGSSGGCGCKVARTENESSTAGLAALALGLGLVVRRRRRS